MKEPIEFCKKVADISNAFEMNTSDLKRQYIVSNIILYNTIMSFVKESKGTFGTGYPFYVLDNNLEGSLPIIEEQIRYNNELKTYTDQSFFTEWRCARCISNKTFEMEDLKQFCKICPGMDDVLKPRKLINRLPDLDLWMICDASDIEMAKLNVSDALTKNGFKTSDIDPVATIYEMAEIVEKLNENKMPKKKLPIDTHIIDNLTLYSLICKIPETIDHNFRHGGIPYLPIHPWSLRKKWQKDDTAYNFVYDYLSSFHEFTIDEKIQDVLNQTRREIAKKYSLDDLYNFLIITGPECVERRNQTPELKECFKNRIESWKELQ